MDEDGEKNLAFKEVFGYIILKFYFYKVLMKVTCEHKYTLLYNKAIGE